MIDHFDYPEEKKSWAFLKAEIMAERTADPTYYIYNLKDKATSYDLCMLRHLAELQALAASDTAVLSATNIPAESRCTHIETTLHWGKAAGFSDGDTLSGEMKCSVDGEFVTESSWNNENPYNTMNTYICKKDAILDDPDYANLSKSCTIGHTSNFATTLSISASVTDLRTP